MAHMHMISNFIKDTKPFNMEILENEGKKKEITL